MDDHQALLALSAWLTEQLPDAGAAELGRFLRRLRGQGLRRRRAARRILSDALLAPLPPERRAELEPVLRWVFGEQWLPPPASDLDHAFGPAARSRSLL